jgi:DNA (cytosine-5)-methyltransferase 1
LLADLILGHEPIIAVEWDKYACRVLRERASDGWFPDLRVWEGDVRLFDPSEYTGVVDCIHAGFPCQDISVAGNQAGVGEGTRSGLYREVIRIAGIVRPRYLFLENVSAILSNGLGTVLGDLAAMGYDCRWICIRASDVGAPHRRDRWFGLATNSRYIMPRQQECSVRQKCEVNVGTVISNLCENMADSSITRLQGGETAGSNGSNRSEQGNEFTTGCSSGAEWYAVEPGLGRVANGIPNRVGQLKGYGNAQVPLQAAVAYRLLGGI